MFPDARPPLPPPSPRDLTFFKSSANLCPKLLLLSLVTFVLVVAIFDGPATALLVLLVPGMLGVGCSETYSLAGEGDGKGMMKVISQALFSESQG
jgi:hypothetical protein